MALPTEAQVQSSIVDVINKLEYIEQEGPQVFIPYELNLLNAAHSDYLPELSRAAAAHRATFAALTSPQAIQSLLNPLLASYGRIINSTNSAPNRILLDLYKWMVDTDQHVNSRGLSFGSITAAPTNSGNGTVNRVTVDAEGYVKENIYPETKKILCINDAFSGATEHEERFSFVGSAIGRDQIGLPGSGAYNDNVYAIAENATATIIRNPSFDSGTTGTDISEWEIDTVANTAKDTTYYYRSLTSKTSPASLKLTNNIVMYYDLSDVVFDPSRPYYVQIAYNRSQYSGDGTLTIALGNTSKSVVLSAQTGWNILRLDLDKNLYFKHFNKHDLRMTITYSGHTTGSVLIDDLICVPMVNLDGTFFAVVGGSTSFLKDDFFTWTDTDGVTDGDGKINKWLWLGYGAYLPHENSTTGSNWSGEGVY